jgi:hypothetical protein
MPSSRLLRSGCPGCTAALLLAALASFAADGEGAKVRLGGAGWMGYGSIMASSHDTTGGVDIVGKPLIASGAQVLLEAQPGENLDIQAGLGAGGGHVLAFSLRNSGGYAPFGVGPYVAQANFTYHFDRNGEGATFLRGGLFDYDYAKETQNLGLYLLRGPVYPGYILSGFETKHVLPVANTLGLQFHHDGGAFQQDVLLQVETEFYPFYDVSPAYLAAFQGEAFRIGGGINFHHLIPVDPDLTTDTTRFRYIDKTNPAAPDTIQLSAKGIKLMVSGMVDMKALFGGVESLGPEDLKFYGEVGVIGLGGLFRDDIPFGSAPKYRKNSKKAYEDLYGPISQRMPMMIGINLPAFKLLDRLAVEVEHYGAPFKDDITKLTSHTSSNVQSVTPQDPDSAVSADDIRWSVYASRVVRKHMKLSLQIASDHFRPGLFVGYGDNAPPSTEAVLYRPKDWYLMTKVAYFF